MFDAVGPIPDDPVGAGTSQAEPLEDPEPWMLRWALRDAVPIPGSRYNKVWLVHRSDGRPAVLKVGDPLARRREAAALRCWTGDGAAELLAAEGPALLSDFVAHTSTVAALADDDATAAVAQAMSRLHRAEVASATASITGGVLPSIDELPDVSGLDFDFRWLRDQPDAPIETVVIDAAERQLAWLLDTTPRRVVLHGDLHHDNLLVTDVGPVAIDPHGWLGDPHFDAASLMANPFGEFSRHAQPLALARRRAMIIAETCGLDIDRLLQWTFVGAVIAEIWCLQDHGVLHGAPLRLAQDLLVSEPRSIPSGSG